ncbi:hypothetical protein B0H16DRAFT_1448267 [Mycena metata]|uniref:Uncharacterized protein n=1 Tax=Mycena metata TaxID=1033252 RepID=A0AAD7KBS2_9AGAR|nr:hypothetical protein B0H16DRAFT_1448267 [Mycena metata]
MKKCQTGYLVTEREMKRERTGSAMLNGYDKDDTCADNGYGDALTMAGRCTHIHADAQPTGGRAADGLEGRNTVGGGATVHIAKATGQHRDVVYTQPSHKRRTRCRNGASTAFEPTSNTCNPERRIKATRNKGNNPEKRKGRAITHLIVNPGYTRSETPNVPKRGAPAYEVLSWAGRRRRREVGRRLPLSKVQQGMSTEGARVNSSVGGRVATSVIVMKEERVSGKEGQSAFDAVMGGWVGFFCPHSSARASRRNLSSNSKGMKKIEASNRQGKKKKERKKTKLLWDGWIHRWGVEPRIPDEPFDPLLHVTACARAQPVLSGFSLQLLRCNPLNSWCVGVTTKVPDPGAASCLAPLNSSKKEKEKNIKAIGYHVPAGS